MTAIEALTGIAPNGLETEPNTGKLAIGEVRQMDGKPYQIVARRVRYNFQERYSSTTEVLRDEERLQTSQRPKSRWIVRIPKNPQNG